MMNAELVSGEEVPVIIPIIFRNNYLSALRALSLNGQPEPLIRTLAFAQKYTSLIRWEKLPIAEKTLEWTNAFVRLEVGEESGISLKLPRSVDRPKRYCDDVVTWGVSTELLGECRHVGCCSTTWH
jgi:hypothetical protein